MSIQYLGIEQVPEDFRKQIRALNKSFDNIDWNKRVIGGAMVVNVNMGFLRQENPKGVKWKSNAPKTKFGGKFSVNYRTRSDGSPVTASSLRLTDSGDLRESYDVLKVMKNDVEVGPLAGGGQIDGRHRNQFIAEIAETKWKNHIVGWGKRGTDLLDHIISRALDYIAQGKLPPKVGYITKTGELRGM
jgi:hypothetical protein